MIMKIPCVLLGGGASSCHGELELIRFGVVNIRKNHAY